MSFRIICLESHFYEEGWGKESISTIMKMAPYITDLCGTYKDDPASYKDNRPHIEEVGRAIELCTASVESRIEGMDVNGIDTQILSTAQPIQCLPENKAIDLSRKINDRFAEIAHKYPSRFGGFFVLPWQNTEAAVREIERAVTELGLTAAQLFGRPAENAMLDDPKFSPILAKLEQLDVPLSLHPGQPLLEVQHAYYAGFSKEVTARFSLESYGWHNEAGIQVIRLILSGALDKYPKLKLISGHWGEMVPFFLERLDDTLPMGATGLKRTISQTYRDQIYVTPSGMLYTPNFIFCKQVLGIERIMFSMDYPYVTMTGARSWLGNLPVSENEKASFAHLNAEKLLKLKC